MYTVKGLVYVASGALEILIPIALGFYLKRRLEVTWRWFFVGAVFFIASLIRFPLNQYASMVILSGSLNYTYKWILVSAFPSLTAGLFEEAARYIAFRYVVKEHTFRNALMYGAGHGGIESIFIVGVNVLFVGAMLLLNPGSMHPTILAAIEVTPAYMPLVGLYERLMAITIHIGLSVMVLKSFTEKDLRYLGAAVLIHFALDFITLLTLGYGVVYPELAATGFALGLGYWTLENIQKSGLTG
ncbi:YhfC family intramembrane metalloprotease [Candidatus Bathyarchaeota archaeon]|nr:YhfC family intramembrane metalloprotease [Candidatus Bathyarchaeota archaeon]